MSLLSSFLASHLIPALEQALIEHAPELQAAFVDEVRYMAESVVEWAENALDLDLNGDGIIGR